MQAGLGTGLGTGALGRLGNAECSMQTVMHLLRSACGLSAAHASFFTFLGSTWRQAHCCFGMAVSALSEMKLTKVAAVCVEGSINFRCTVPAASSCCMGQ